MKRVTAIAAGVVAALALMGGVANAAITASSSVTIQPQKSLYKSTLAPVNLTFNAKINASPGSPTLTPLMESKFNVPKDLAFVPNPKMPTCSFTTAEANVPPSTARAHCPKAIIGDGTAGLDVAQSVAGRVNDPVITIFNGKPDGKKGVLVIQAYSATTNAGILMSGEINNGVLDVKIPRLTFDSSVPEFQLSIPGSIGQNKSYAQATCSTGKYTSNAVFTLGKRSDSGTVSDQQVITTDPTTTTCKASAGKAKLSLKVKGPKKVKSGKKGTFKVTVKNTGTGASKKGKVTASGGGKGSASIPAVQPGKSKTVKVKVKVKGKKGKKVTVKFKSPSGGSGKAKVKVG